jgi:hypothetical protein
VVRQGEYLTKIAWRCRVPPAEIWDHPKNADLKALRDHGDILCSGDVLFVPNEPPPGLPLAAGTSNQYVAEIPKVDVRVALHHGDEVLKNEDYLVRGLTPPATGTTDEDGKITLSIPVDIREIVVELPNKVLRFELQIGDMDCLQEDSGVLMRLQNLGYARGRGAVDPDALRAALAAFQKDHDIDVTGEIDDATREALGKIHGS